MSRWFDKKQGGSASAAAAGLTGAKSASPSPWVGGVARAAQGGARPGE